MNFTQAGEQLVNMGSGPPVRIRWASSDASSMMVRSAEKLVSKTRLNPSRRRAAFRIPATSWPGFSPNSSARVTDTAGACWITAIRSGSARAARISSAWLRSTSAPVGQIMTHWPQLTQLDTLSPSLKAVPTTVLLPRLMKLMAETPWISSQTRTHLPQRMHLAGSRMIDGLDRSTLWSTGVPPKRRCWTPSSAARARSRHESFRWQYRQSSGWLASRSSTMVFRARRARGEWVWIFIPSLTG